MTLIADRLHLSQSELKAKLNHKFDYLQQRLQIWSISIAAVANIKIAIFVCFSLTTNAQKILPLTFSRAAHDYMLLCETVIYE
jgi:hypothetical protein